jgi:acyl-CoA synthetase (AMP-forming)/AMP-acid ligase II
MLSHRNLLMNAYYVGARQRMSEADRLCIPVPFYHCFGCVMGTLMCSVYGAAMIVPAPYAIRALRNQCFSMLRRRRSSSLTSPLLEPSAPDASEEERLILDEALLRLPVEQREVVYLKVFDGMTLQEIAALSGASINTIGSRYRYAMSALRKALGESESTT